MYGKSGVLGCTRFTNKQETTQTVKFTLSFIYGNKIFNCNMTFNIVKKSPHVKPILSSPQSLPNVISVDFSVTYGILKHIFKMDINDSWYT